MGVQWYYFLAAIPVFGLLVLVHELGHFITAKWAGIRVEEFGIGFPTRIRDQARRDDLLAQLAAHRWLRAYAWRERRDDRRAGRL